MGSCRHHIWQAIRASSAAPYYLDDYSDGGKMMLLLQIILLYLQYEKHNSYGQIQKLTPLFQLDVVLFQLRFEKVVGVIWLPVLVESACSIQCVEDMLSTLLSMIPEIQYFRFNPVNERCDMELDETDPTIWLKLEAATNDYIKNNCQAFKKV